MPSRKSQKWQSRRKPSLGQLRRAHPASGATWNVQVVRGKMTSKCLWHACRALVLGMVLMLLGAGMATIGYYADQLSIGHEIRGNATVRVKNESRGFHLNNLSYAGPIVMGFGGFIVVAACVMTFEARDSAAKVVPARFKLSNNSRTNIRSNTSSGASARRANGVMHQNTRWDHHLGVFRTSPADPPQTEPPLDRQALTAALIHFSKTMGNTPVQSPKFRRFSRSGSVPNLAANTSKRSSINSAQLSPSYRRQLLTSLAKNSSVNPLFNIKPQHNGHHSKHRHHHHRKNDNNRTLSKSKSSRVSSSLVSRTTRESSSSLLHPGSLHKLHRHALSVDETGPYFQSPSDEHNRSLTSIIMLDSNESRRIEKLLHSDMSKRPLLRQKPIEKEELHHGNISSPKLPERRRSSTASDNSYASRYRRTSSASRTTSAESRSVQVELHSPEKQFSNRPSPRTPRRHILAQSSTPSMEREIRSQQSISSEPNIARQLSGQSSLEPCVLEESPEYDENNIIQQKAPDSPVNKTQNNIIPHNEMFSNNNKSNNLKKQRPGSLKLNGNYDCTKYNKITEMKNISLQRSNSSRTFYRSKPKPINEYNTIYFISSNGGNNNSQSQVDDNFFDIINERRKILKSESEITLVGNNNNQSANQIKSIYENLSKTISDSNNDITQIADTTDNISDKKSNIINDIEKNNDKSQKIQIDTLLNEIKNPNLIEQPFISIINENISKKSNNIELNIENKIYEENLKMNVKENNNDLHGNDSIKEIKNLPSTANETIIIEVEKNDDCNNDKDNEQNI